MKFYALTRHSLVLMQTVLCDAHFAARWIDELITHDHDDKWKDVTSYSTVRCQICGAQPPPQCTDYYVCGNIKVPKP
jgi:hypothetical protein